MFRKILICCAVSFTLALLMPLMTTDLYVPTEQIDLFSEAELEPSEAFVHKTNEAGFFEKIKFYLSSKFALLEYLKMVSVWFQSAFKLL